ncbi:MAG TPA: hybrid sensor histidine kinase/response regulator, partial [Burkholderiaceae bacterium]
MADPTPAPHSPDPRIAALEAELAALRKEAAERAALQTMVDQLRDANEHLVLASLHAQARQDEAEAANRRQNEFLAMLAHELRNPLAPISMAALLLEKMPDSSQQLRKVQAIVSRQVNQISRLLDDLLDAARISSGKIALVPHSVLLSEIIERTIETVQPRIEERSQQLTVELPLHEVVLEGDPVRLTQVLANLLVNASKFTPNGGQLSLRAALAEYGVEIAVQDNGIGLASDLMPHVFDLFTQGPRSLARPEGGLGIGLNVVRNLVQMHGGSVAVHSDGLGQGATFTVSLPVSDASAPPVRLVRETSIRIASRCRVLLVEDNTDACAMLAGVLEMEGYEVVCTANGSSGLALAMDSQFDVLL